MKTGSVAAQIEMLVDHLRENRERDISLGDIAAVTEVLLTTMQRYFSAIDTTIYSEFRAMSDRITSARTEIAQMSGDQDEDEHIPRAGRELEAIVQATEEASSNIMDAAEEIMGLDLGADGAADAVNDACMRIFEACSFQDITGQRINKVIETLTYIENRLSGLENALEAKLNAADAKSETTAKNTLNEDDPEFERKHLLKGPALEGEGIDQSAVDSLMSGADAPAEDEAAAADEKKSAKVAPKKAKKPAEPAPAESGEAISQDDIDALFD